MTRRDFAATLAMASPLAAIQPGTEIKSGDVYLTLIDNHDGSFAVGVRAARGDTALVEIFHETEDHLILTEESIAPVFGMKLLGGTRRNFRIPIEAIRNIRLTLYRTIETKEFHEPVTAASARQREL